MCGQNLNVGFKGERTYIQGGDIFDAINVSLSDEAPPAWVSHLAFRHFARRDCSLCWTRPENDVSLIAQGNARFGDGDRAFWVVESDKEACGRRPFDEDSLVAPAVSDQNSIILNGRSDHSPIEEIIALTKRLSYELMSEVDGKWVFGQLDLEAPLAEEYSSLRIERTNMIGNRFSVNSIEIDGNRIGDIRFIVGSP